MIVPNEREVFEMEKQQINKYAVYGITSHEPVKVKWFKDIHSATIYAEKIRNDYEKVKLNWYRQMGTHGGCLFIKALQTWKNS